MLPIPHLVCTEIMIEYKKHKRLHVLAPNKIAKENKLLMPLPNSRLQFINERMPFQGTYVA